MGLSPFGRVRQVRVPGCKRQKTTLVNCSPKGIFREDDGGPWNHKAGWRSRLVNWAVTQKAGRQGLGRTGLLTSQPSLPLDAGCWDPDATGVMCPWSSFSVPLSQRQESQAECAQVERLGPSRRALREEVWPRWASGGEPASCHLGIHPFLWVFGG